MTKLALHGGRPTIDAPGPHYRWPIITDATRRAVLAQLETATSIKDRTGIIRELEDKFASYYGRRYALLCNSGTSSLFAAFEGLGLGPGDEVISADYTWFASISPVVYLGATPVFCDCDANGSLDPARLGGLLTERTRAVVVTHMWGRPCDMDEIVAFCEANGLALVEDCSHAHGATYKGRLVGTFGAAAAWSMQSSKLVSGGEGGILLTDDEDVYVRAQLQGHYNKRCKQEVPLDHLLRPFWQTGFGLKLRCHPLGAAMASQQFDEFPPRLELKRRYARKVVATLADVPFLFPQDETDRESSWYSLALRYDARRAGGIPLKLFQEALLAEGLAEADIPSLTGPIGALPLFTELSRAMPRLYRDWKPRRRDCPVSDGLGQSVIVFPVWGSEEDEPMVNLYIEGLLKVCDAVSSGGLAGEAN